MMPFARPLLAVVAAFGLAGCSASGPSADPGPAPTKESGSALANLDPCDIMTPQQLQLGGFEFTERAHEADFEPGCVYDSDSVNLSIYKNQQETVRSYKENGTWAQYDFVRVNDREGARARVPQAMETCSTLIPAGGGVILVSAQNADPRHPIDGCVESLEIAEQIEPRLPE